MSVFFYLRGGDLPFIFLTGLYQNASLIIDQSITQSYYRSANSIIDQLFTSQNAAFGFWILITKRNCIKKNCIKIENWNLVWTRMRFKVRGSSYSCDSVSVELRDPCGFPYLKRYIVTKRCCLTLSCQYKYSVFSKPASVAPTVAPTHNCATWEYWLLACLLAEC